MALEEFGNYLENPWIQSAVIIVVSIFVTAVVLWLLGMVLSNLVTRTKTLTDDIAIKALRNAIFYTIPIIGTKLALSPFDLTSSIPQKVLFSVLIILLARSLLRLVTDLLSYLQQSWTDRTHSTMNDGLFPLFKNAIITVIVILAILLILGEWEVKIGPLLGALGIGGLAVGLALNSSLSNIFGGIQLILDRSISVGDKIMLESGELGVVMDIGLRSTKLRTYENEVISVPNSQLSNARIKNYTKPDISIRVTVDFGVVYGSDVSQVKQVVLDAIGKMKDILSEPNPQVIFLNMSNFSLDMSARVWVDNYDKQFGHKLEMTELIYNVLNENDIEIPFPTQTVHIQKP
ncbi:mechanosensitive ion channel family protein [Pseudomonadota bacterium]